MKLRLLFVNCLLFFVATATEKPNIIFIMLDDLGYAQIEAFSRGLTVEQCDPKFLDHIKRKGKYSTDQAFAMMKKASPTISRLADEGVQFNNAFGCSNLCAPARMGIATGMLQNRWGVYRNIDAEAHGLNANSHLAEKIRARGYATAHIGKWHIGSRDDDMIQSYLEKFGQKRDKKMTLWSLGKKFPNIKKALLRDGYAGSVVKKDHPLRNGFDYYYGYNQWECPFYNFTNVWEDYEPVGLVKKYNTDVFTDKTMGFIERSIQQSKPFYIQLHYHAVHSPLTPKAPQKYLSRFNSGVPILDNFYAHVYGVDQNIKRLQSFLKSKQQDQNTIIVFTSDNGGAVGSNSCFPGNGVYSGHKGMLLQGGFRVPLFFHWPAQIKKPLTKNQLVSTLDIIPTAIAAAGGQLPEGLDGKSLLPQILKDSKQPVRNHFLVGGIHARVWAFNGATSFFTHNVSREKAPSGYVVADDRYLLRYVSETMPKLYKDAVQGIDAHYELYDYVNDPGERHDLANQSPEKLQQLKKVWEAQSVQFPKPVAWGEDKWKAIIKN